MSLVALNNRVSSEYFTTMGIPLLLGRDFESKDEPEVAPDNRDQLQLARSAGGGRAYEPPLCILDESLARRLFGEANPVGRHVCYSRGMLPCERGTEIVGVVKGVRYGSLKAADFGSGTVYEPSWSNGAGVRWLVVRYSGSLAPVVTGVRRALADEDPTVPLLRVRTMKDYLNDQLSHERLIAYLSSLFGVLALGLASMGLYGVLAYLVTQRTREIGIRMALGARRTKVVAMILRESIVPVATGLVIGMAAAIAWSLFLGTLLYGVSPWDPKSIMFAVVVMLAAALAAAALPARQATKVDPMVALRYE